MQSAVVRSSALHGRSNLAILLFLLTSGIAGLIICLAVMLFIRLELFKISILNTNSLLLGKENYRRQKYPNRPN